MGDLSDLSRSNDAGQLRVTARDRFTGPIRVGLLTPYFAFFESRFPEDFRASQEAYAAGLAVALQGIGFEVAASGLVDGAQSAASAGQRFADAGVDVVVAAPTMAAPPTHEATQRQAIESVPTLPPPMK